MREKNGEKKGITIIKTAMTRDFNSSDSDRVNRNNQIEHRTQQTTLTLGRASAASSRARL